MVRLGSLAPLARRQRTVPLVVALVATLLAGGTVDARAAGDVSTQVIRQVWVDSSNAYPHDLTHQLWSGSDVQDVRFDATLGSVYVQADQTPGDVDTHDSIAIEFRLPAFVPGHYRTDQPGVSIQSFVDGCSEQGEFTIDRIDPEAGVLGLSFAYRCPPEDDTSEEPSYASMIGQVRIGVPARVVHGMVGAGPVHLPPSEVNETQVRFIPFENVGDEPQRSMSFVRSAGSDRDDVRTYYPMHGIHPRPGQVSWVRMVFAPQEVGERSPRAVFAQPETTERYRVPITLTGLSGTSYELYDLRRATGRVIDRVRTGPDSTHAWGSGDGGRGVYLSTNGYATVVAAPQGQRLHVGHYEDAVDWRVHGDRPGFYNEGLADCQESLTGSFDVSEVHYRPGDGRVDRAAVAFDVTCARDGRHLTGAVGLHTLDPAWQPIRPLRTFIYVRPAHRRVMKGSFGVFRGTLRTRFSFTRLAGQEVRVERCLGRALCRRYAVLRTDENGEFRLRMRITKRTRIRAHFPGTEDHRRSSDRAKIHVLRG